jgi:hypothetical protein
MGQNVSPRATRQAVLESRISEFAGFRLAVDCGTATCGGERTYGLAELARMCRGDMRVRALITRLRCHKCGGAARACFIETGPELAARGRMRRLALVGRDDGDPGR